MNPDNPSGENPEHTETNRHSVDIEDLSTYSGMSMAEIVELNVRYVLDQFKQGGYDAETYRRMLALPDDAPEPAIRSALQAIAESYTERVAQRIELFRQHAERCRQLVEERGFVPGQRQARVVLTDMRLGAALESHGLIHETNRYNPNNDVAFVSIESSNTVLRHELGHLFSTRPEAGTGGFLDYERSVDGTLDAKPRWFDEGATVVWEEYSQVGENDEPNRADPQDFFGWAGRAARLIATEAGLDEDTLLRAYFGDEASHQRLVDGIRQRFGMTLDDLECLAVRCDIDFTKRVLHGGPVELSFRRGRDHPSVLKDNQELARRFPNVKLMIEESPKHPGAESS